MLSQLCDPVEKSIIMEKQISSTKSTVVPIQSSPSNGYSIEKQSMGDKSPSIMTQQFPSSNLRQVPISPISFNTSFKSDNFIPSVCSDMEYLNNLSGENLIYRLKTLENKNRRLSIENGSLIRDLNSNLANIQLIRHQIHELEKDNNELRDLCCYLDDERTRARAVAREWESFGDHMSKVLKKEISNYNKKLQQLELKQFELVKENYELKQLCLLLDKAMINKTTMDKGLNREMNNRLVDNNQSKYESKDASSEPTKRKSLFNHKILNYIKLLENKLEQYQIDRQLTSELPKIQLSKSPNDESENFKINRPDELNKAMEILDLEQSLDIRKDEHKADELANETINDKFMTADKSENRLVEFSTSDSTISEDQKSIIKQLCSAAYKKIEDE